MSDEVLIDLRDGAMEITINRPQVRNALNRSAAEAIAAAMERLDDDESLRCAIISGADGTFCSGMDLKGFLTGDMPLIPGRGFAGVTSWTPAKPLIAAVDGYALAGGMELMLACDLVVAHVDARFGIPEARRGLIAAAGGVVRLARALPRVLAMELALTGETIDAHRAYELGLVNRLTHEPAIGAARALAAAIAQSAPLSVIGSKQIVRQSWSWGEDEIEECQAPFVASTISSQDAMEGARPFTEKRKPDWQGK